MKIKINKRLLNILIFDSIILFTGCNNNGKINEAKIVIEDDTSNNLPTVTPTISDNYIKDDNKKSVSNNNTISQNEINIVSDNTINKNNEEIEIFEWELPKYITYVRAVNSTNIYSDMNVESEVLGFFKRNDRLIKKDDFYEDFYQVEYNNQSAYVLKENCEVVVRQEFNNDFIKVVKINKDASIYTDEYLETPIVIYDSFEVAEVYQEHDNVYLVKTSDYVGYVNKDDTVDILDDTFVVVDKSSQNLILYNNNEIVIDTPVVTGLPTADRDTPIGDYNIWHESYNRYLTGPGYSSYVNAFWAFYKGYGLHDAEYYTEENGFKHGWRNYSDFGKETWKTKGSHGCVNMPHDETIEMKKYVKKDTRVLIKK